MPKFLDAHALKGTDEETIKNLQNAPADEFGIKHVNLMYNQEEDRFSISSNFFLVFSISGTSS